MDNYVHVNAGLTDPDPECDLDCVKDHGIDKEVNTVLSNSLGFVLHICITYFFITYKWEFYPKSAGTYQRPIFPRFLRLLFIKTFKD